MRAHLYEVKVYEGDSDFLHGGLPHIPQRRLYIPSQDCVITFRDERGDIRVDGFLDDNFTLSEAERIIHGLPVPTQKVTLNPKILEMLTEVEREKLLKDAEEQERAPYQKCKYFGEIELPENIVYQIIKAQNRLKSAKNSFEDIARPLFKAVEYSSDYFK